MKHRIYIIWALLMPFAIVSAQELELSLGEALKRGLENNYGIRITNQNLRIASNNNSWGQAGLFPVVTAGLNQNNIFSNITNEVQSQHTLSPYIRVNWTLFDGFSAIITKKRLEELQSLSEGNAAIVVENTIQAIILAYYNAELQQERLKVLLELMSLSRDRYNYELMRQSLGNAVTFDVLQAKNAYLADSSDYLLQKLNYETAVRNMNLILAEPVQNKYSLTEEFVFLPKDYSPDSLMADMLENNKTLKNQYINQELLKHEITFQKSNLYPTLILNSELQSQEVSSLSESMNFYANFSLSYTLSNGGRVRRGIENAKIEEEIGMLEIAELTHNLKNRIYNQHELYQARLQIYQVAIENENAARLNLSIAKDKYDLGAITSFNYRDIQLIFLNAALNKLRSVYDLIEAHTELLRLTGNVIADNTAAD